MVEIGDQQVARAFNGHLMEYRVIGVGADGRARVSQWDAAHAAECDCRYWEDGDTQLPDW